jgi:hypothetical protein
MRFDFNEIGDANQSPPHHNRENEMLDQWQKRMLRWRPLFIFTQGRPGRLPSRQRAIQFPYTRP